MSQVYSTEPQTSGRVILETTHGPFEIQLWCRECPATTRFFLQLCLDGFYENMIFHRVVPDFLIQTGALRHGKKDTVTDSEIDSYRRGVNADQAIERRNYELNTRIRFNHRGQVAMALDINDDNDLAVMQPQFFITLDEASHLDGNHVIFGTVSGPTVFNALRIGKTDVDEETSQPTIMEEAPRIERVKIIENPIHTEIVPSKVVPWKIESSEGAAPKKKKKRKGVKNVNLLSFGEEVDEEAFDKGGMKSSHDVIESKNLSKEVDKQLKKVVADNKSKALAASERTKDDTITDLAGTLQERKKESSRNGNSEDNQKECSVNDEVAKAKDPPNEIKKAENGSDGKLSKPTKDTQKKPKHSLVEARRAKYAQKSKDKQQREENTMARLFAFQKKMKEVSKNDTTKSDQDDGLASRMARRARADDNKDKQEDAEDQAVSYHGQILENDADVQNDWMKTTFKCRKHMDHDAKLGGDGRSAMDDYEVVEDRNSKRQKHQHRHHRRGK